MHSKHTNYMNTMTKKLFLVNSLLFYSCAFSQVLTYVGNSALVTIQSQTLFYNGGGLQTAGTAVVNNSGNVMISGTATGVAATEPKIELGANANFNIRLASITDYGQLYITGIIQNNISGKVNKEYRADANSGTTAKQQIALPFFDYKIADLTSNIAASTANNTAGNYFNVTNGANSSAGRFNPSSVFKWNNARARFDQIVAGSSALATTNVGGPLDYYIIPRRNNAGTAVWDAALATSVTTFVGIPVSDSGGNQSFNLLGAASGINFGYNGSAANYYGERYYSYLDDPFQSKTGNGGTWDVLYGKNLYQVANPFLTNIDLRYIGTAEATNSDNNVIPNLQGVAYYTSGLTWVRNGGTSYPTVGTGGGQTIKMTATSGVFQSGDVSANRLIIKPMGEFMIKLSTDNGSNTASKIDFSLLRRFSGSSRDNATQTTNPSSKTFSTDDIVIPTDKIVKQLGVIMYDMDSLEIGRTYYAVSPSAVTGNSPSNTLMQAYNGEESYIYTKEEIPNGGEDLNVADKLYINEANEVAFATKKIPLNITYTATPYYLQFEVYEKGNRVGDNGLSSGKEFYIETSNNQFVKINDGDYLSMNGSKSLGLYYDKPEGGTLGTGNLSSSQTVIAKKDSQWVVRFSKNWNKASVEVYSVAGQLLNSKSQISTGSDYTIPLNYQAKGVFLVKAVSDKGEVVIKKINN